MKDQQAEENLVTKRVNGRLHRVTKVRDKRGNVIHHLVQPLMVELHRRDYLQIMVGATVLAIPVAFTGEVWELSETLPMLNIVGLLVLSLLFLAGFVYANFYHGYLKGQTFNLCKRVLVTYGITISVVAVLLALLGKMPLLDETVVSLKRLVLVCFPATMAASLTDSLK